MRQKSTVFTVCLSRWRLWCHNALKYFHQKKIPTVASMCIWSALFDVRGQRRSHDDHRRKWTLLLFTSTQCYWRLLVFLSRWRSLLLSHGINDSDEGNIRADKACFFNMQSVISVAKSLIVDAKNKHAGKQMFASLLLIIKIIDVTTERNH